MNNVIHSDPLDVESDNGAVVVILPDGSGLWMAPRAAEETSQRILQAAFRANGERLNR